MRNIKKNLQVRERIWEMICYIRNVSLMPKNQIETN